MENELAALKKKVEVRYGSDTNYLLILPLKEANIKRSSRRCQDATKTEKGAVIQLTTRKDLVY